MKISFMDQDTRRNMWNCMSNIRRNKKDLKVIVPVEKELTDQNSKMFRNFFSYTIKCNFYFLLNIGEKILVSKFSDHTTVSIILIFIHRKVSWNSNRKQHLKGYCRFSLYCYRNFFKIWYVSIFGTSWITDPK